MESEILCLQCHSVVRPKRIRPKRTTHAPLWFIVILFCLGIVPGLIYWYYIAKSYPVCPDCGGTSLAPVDSVTARDFEARREAEVAALLADKVD